MRFSIKIICQHEKRKNKLVHHFISCCFKVFSEKKRFFLFENKLCLSRKWNRLNAIKSIFLKFKEIRKRERIYFVEVGNVDNCIIYERIINLIYFVLPTENTNKILPKRNKKAFLPIYTNFMKNVSKKSFKWILNLILR